MNDDLTKRQELAIAGTGGEIAHLAERLAGTMAKGMRKNKSEAEYLNDSYLHYSHTNQRNEN